MKVVTVRTIHSDPIGVKKIRFLIRSADIGLMIFMYKSNEIERMFAKDTRITAYPTASVK